MLVVKISTVFCFSSLLFIFCFRCQFTANMLNSMSTHYKIKHPEAENPDYVERSTDSQNFSQEFWKEEWGIPTLQVCDCIERLSCAQEHFCKTREHDLLRNTHFVIMRSLVQLLPGAGLFRFSIFNLCVHSTGALQSGKLNIFLETGTSSCTARGKTSIICKKND